MLIARVKGSVTATVKNSCLEGFKLLLVETLDLEGNGTGKEFLAVDIVDAGLADIVLLCMEGGAVSSVMEISRAACDAAIVGVIDSIQVNKE